MWNESLMVVSRGSGTGGAGGLSAARTWSYMQYESRKEVRFLSNPSPCAPFAQRSLRRGRHHEQPTRARA